MLWPRRGQPVTPYSILERLIGLRLITDLDRGSNGKAGWVEFDFELMDDLAAAWKESACQ